MEMPISLKITSLENQLINDINNAKLPTYIVLPIIKEIYEQINKLNIEKTQQDKQEYEKSLKGE